MHLLFQDVITIIPNYFAFLIMPSIDFNFQNSAARLVFPARKRDFVTPLLGNIHWLPIQCRIQFKILLMTCKVLRGQVPSYVRDLITRYVSTRRLRSQNKLPLHQPRFHLKSYGQRVFKTSAPCLSNDLPYNIQKSINVNFFLEEIKDGPF